MDTMAAVAAEWQRRADQSVWRFAVCARAMRERLLRRLRCCAGDIGYLMLPRCVSHRLDR